MLKKNVIRIFLIIFCIFLAIIIFNKFFKKDQFIQPDNLEEESQNLNSNIIENVSYISKDAKGNEYIINAVEGQIDLNNSNIIFLTDVTALIKLNDSNNIDITSDFGKYNINNYDTIFSKNVIVDYLDNKITGEYLDFSLKRNSMIVSRDIIYTTTENVLRADVIETNIETKDTKIFMHDINKKVNIRSIN